MPTFIGGLPLHPLVVHAVVVFVPLAALAAIVVAVWPAARRRYGWLAVAVAAVAAVSNYVAEQAGEALEHLIPRDAAIEAHTSIGDELKYWTIPLLVLVAAVVFLNRRADLAGRREGPGTTTAPRLAGGQRVLAMVLAALTVVVAVGATYEVVRIGDSGARAVWGDGRVYQEQPRPTHAPG